MTRLVAIVLAAVFSLWMVSAALAAPAGAGGGQHRGAGNVTQPAPPDVKEQAKDKKDKKDTKTQKAATKKQTKKTGTDKPGLGDEKGNKGGQERGLDRADAVAGVHGQQGRDNARAKQSR